MHVHDAAFEQLYTEYVHRLIRYARAQGQSGDVAEELVQDTFHEAYAQLAHLTEHENPGGWLMQTLKNKIRNYDRARQRERRLIQANNGLSDSSFPMCTGMQPNILTNRTCGCSGYC